MQSQKITQFDIDTNGYVLLRTGKRVKNDAVEKHLDNYLNYLKKTKSTDPSINVIYSDFFELSNKCKNPEFNFTDGAKARLKMFALLDSLGNILPDVKNIIESAASVTNGVIEINDPRAKFSNAENSKNHNTTSKEPDRVARHSSLKEIKKMSNPYPQPFVSTISTAQRANLQNTHTNSDAPVIIHLPRTKQTEAENLEFKQDNGWLICTSPLPNTYRNTIKKLSEQYGCQFESQNKIPKILIDTWKKAKANFDTMQHLHEFTLEIKFSSTVKHLKFKLEYRYSEYRYFANFQDCDDELSKRLKKLSFHFTVYKPEISLGKEYYVEVLADIKTINAMKNVDCKFEIVDEIGTPLHESKRLNF